MTQSVLVTKPQEMLSGDIGFHFTAAMLRAALRGVKDLDTVFISERHVCCDCGLAHRMVAVPDGEGGMMELWYRDDAYTEALRKMERARKRK